MYNKKTVVWRHKQEISLYENPIYTQEDKMSEGHGKKGGKRKQYKEMNEQEKALSNQRRCRYYKRKAVDLKNLAIHNNLDTFITLTFRDDITEYSIAKHYWGLFIKRLRYALEKTGIDMKYIATHELQKRRGDVFHFHMITNTGFFPHEQLARIWKYGIVYIELVKDYNSKEKGIGYITKYIGKGITEDCGAEKRDTARKVYCSRNLEQPAVFKEVSTEDMTDIVFANMENVMSTSSYKIKNYLGETINKVDCIEVKKGGQ